MTNVFRFNFQPCISLVDAEMSLHLAMYAVEGLFGMARVRLDMSYFMDEPRRTILVDGTTEVGGAVVRVFTNLLLREFGEDAFHVGRMQSHQCQPQELRA